MVQWIWSSVFGQATVCELRTTEVRLTTQINRRAAISSMIATSAAAVTGPLLASTVKPAAGFGRIAKYVHPKVSWSYVELNEFLEVLPDAGLVSLQKSLHLIPHDRRVTRIVDRAAVRKSIQTQLLWVSSNVVPRSDQGQLPRAHEVGRQRAGGRSVDSRYTTYSDHRTGHPREALR